MKFFLKIKKAYAFLLCFVFMFVFSGCEFEIFNPNETMRAPRATGSLEGVQDALEAQVGGDIILKYPKCENTRSAFSVHDLNSDGINEVLAFYQLRSEGEVTRMNLLKLNDGKWQSIQDISPLGNELLEISYSDLDGDGTDELITGWSIYSSKTNQLCIHKMQENGLVQIASEVYSVFTVCDIDMDSQNELAIIALDTVNKTSKIDFYRFNKEGLLHVSNASLDGSVTSYATPQTGKLKNGNTAIFLDAYKDQNAMITELIYYKDNAPVSYFYNEKTESTTKTLRYYTVLCNDIDEDGYLEIPFSVPLSGFENEKHESEIITVIDSSTISDSASSAVDSTHYLISWRQFDGEKLTDDTTVWYCRTLGFYYRFNKSWQNDVTVSVNEKDHTAVFLCTKENENENVTLLTIKRVTAADWDSDSDEAETVLHKTPDYIWTAKVTDTKSKCSVTISDAANNFFLIES